MAKLLSLLFIRIREPHQCGCGHSAHQYPRRKIELLSGMGIDHLVVIPFTEFRRDDGGGIYRPVPDPVFSTAYTDHRVWIIVLEKEGPKL